MRMYRSIPPNVTKKSGGILLGFQLIGTGDEGSVPIFNQEFASSVELSALASRFLDSSPVLLFENAWSSRGPELTWQLLQLVERGQYSLQVPKL